LVFKILGIFVKVSFGGAVGFGSFGVSGGVVEGGMAERVLG